MHEDQSLLRRRMASFIFAAQGVATLFRTQIHAWVHLLATFLVVTAGITCSITPIEWALLILAMGLVWTAEAVNTAVEFTVDVACPEPRELAGKAKDVAAAAVLLASLTAFGVGICVFYAHLCAWLE